MIHPSAQVHDSVHIDCADLEIGAGAIIRKGCELYGTRIHIGRDFFMDEYSVIGGGSAGELDAGDFFHMGMFAQINTARPVRIGHEVATGIATKVFTHGAYLSEWDGFPVSFDGVTLGNRVWLPNAIVMPGVHIDDDVVVGAGSVVVSDLPSGVLAAGVPARIVKRDVYPSVPLDRAEILKRICDEAGVGDALDDERILCGSTLFYLEARRIVGPATENTEQVKNQLRRHGIRFRYSPVNGMYERWT